MKNSPPFSLLLVLLFPPLSFSLSIYFWLQFTVICKAKWTSRNCQVGGAMVVVVIVIFFYDRSTVVVLHIPFFFDWSSSFFPEFTFFSLFPSNSTSRAGPVTFFLSFFVHPLRMVMMMMMLLLFLRGLPHCALVQIAAPSLISCATHFADLYIRKKTSLTFDGRQKS